jgi:hypothetical protein
MPRQKQKGGKEKETVERRARNSRKNVLVLQKKKLTEILAPSKVVSTH